MKRQILLSTIGWLFSMALIAGDADLRQMLVGTWNLTATNTTPAQVTQTMSTETTYRPDGTFAMTGDLGMISPTNSKTFTIPSKPNPFSKTIGGTGIWHIEQNRLYTTTTNSTSIATNVVHCYEIIALNEHLFTYRMTGHLQGQIRTETRK